MMTDKYTALTEEKDENTIIAERRGKLAARMLWGNEASVSRR